MVEEKGDGLDNLRAACYGSLRVYAHVIEPHRLYGQCHDDAFDWWQQCEESGISNDLLLFPRDHQKSHMIAVRCCWNIMRDPSTTIVYLSATTGLAELQVADIQQILTSDIHMTLWPDLVNPVEGKRSLWNQSSFNTDHPKRKAEGVRDPTCVAAGLTTVSTGWHCKILVKDDVVVPENAYTKEGRDKVEKKCSQMASILTTGGKEWVVGTRYHGGDHYATLMNMTIDLYNDEGVVEETRPLYATNIRVVEENGVFLWPRAARPDGVKFGFDYNELAAKKAKYSGDRLQFNAQYYQNPNDPEGDKINTSMFMYYNRNRLKFQRGKWYYLGRELNVVAGIDLAYSLSRRSDFTVIPVVGIDWEGNRYILDIARFKTANVQGYFDMLSPLYDKWRFKYCRAEVTAAQVVIVNELRGKFEDAGLHIKIEDFRPSKHLGAKEERIAAALKPAYKDNTVYHYRGGECATLEAELTEDNPAHDDTKDAVAQVFSYPRLKRPIRSQSEMLEDEDDLWGDAPKKQNHIHVTRFGSTT